MKAHLEHDDVAAFFAAIERWRDETNLNPAAALLAMHAATYAVEQMLMKGGATRAGIDSIVADATSLGQTYADAFDARRWLGFAPSEKA
jgi:hypothetical protein